MKHKTLPAILIAFVVLSLACGACGLAGDVIEETSGDEDSPAATRPPDDKPDEPPADKPDKPPGDAPSGKEIKGIPTYPGASEVMSATPPQVPGAAAGYKDVEAALYETTDDKDKVCDFYEDKMPKAGWDKVISMPVDEGCITSWVSKDGETGATVVVAEQPDGTVYISMVAGKTE